VCFVVCQLMFSESLPTDVRPGDKVYVVVDGIAYLIVNDDGTELASTNDHLPSNGPISTQCDDSVPPVDWLTSLPNGNFNSMDMSLDNTEVSKQASPQLLGEKISASGDSWETGKTNAELMGSSGVTILQNNDSQLHAVLAEDDDEFEHLSSELSDKPLEIPDRPAATSSKTVGVGNSASFTNSFLGFLEAKKKSDMLKRPTLPKFMIQPRQPQFRLPTPTTSNTSLTATTTINASTGTPLMHTTRPVSVITHSPGSSPKKPIVTTTVKSTGTLPRKLADPSPAVSSIVEILSTEIGAVSPTAAAAAKTTVTAKTVKPSRQPRVTKRMTLSSLFVWLFILLGTLATAAAITVHTTAMATTTMTLITTTTILLQLTTILLLLLLMLLFLICLTCQIIRVFSD